MVLDLIKAPATAMGLLAVLRFAMTAGAVFSTKHTNPGHEDVRTGNELTMTSCLSNRGSRPASCRKVSVSLDEEIYLVSVAESAIEGVEIGI